MFIWDLLLYIYTYLPGGEQVQKESDIYPVAVPQKDSKLLFIGFQAEAEKSNRWSEGRYEIQVLAGPIVKIA